MAFLYAAHNLKDYLALHDFSWPKHGPEFCVNGLFDGVDALRASVNGTAANRAKDGGPAGERPPKRAVAVLPLTVVADFPGFNADSVTDHIVAELSRIDWISTIGGPLTSAYRGQDPDPQKVGRKLNTQYVLVGSTRESGGEVQVTVRLVQTESGEEVWSDRYRVNPQSDDVAAAEDRIAFAVASRVDAQLANSERARAMRKR